MTKKNWVRDVNTGDKYAVTDDTYLILTIENRLSGQSLSRFDKGRPTLITSTGMYLSPDTDDPEKLKLIEERMIAAMKVDQEVSL